MPQPLAPGGERLAKIAKPPRDLANQFTICTIVTDPDEYAGMRASFRARGFDERTACFLFADNSAGNAFDAFEAYNVFLQQAETDYIILCHQDILLIDDGFDELVERLDELTRKHPSWGLCGNAGGRKGGTLAIRITDPAGSDYSKGGPFPVPVSALDENFIVVRRDANLAVSHDLAGFHFYGADLCIIAAMLGRSAYVIDFHLQHKSSGTLNASFYDVRNRITQKYRKALLPRWIEVTTGRPFFISGNAATYALAKARRGVKWRLTHLLQTIMRRKDPPPPRR